VPALLGENTLLAFAEHGISQRRVILDQNKIRGFRDGFLGLFGDLGNMVSRVTFVVLHE
jgi:hypothetical protein